MQIELQPENFVLVFQKSEWLYSKYCLIRVLAEYDMFNFVMKGLKDPVPRKTYNKNPTGVVVALNETHNMIFNLGSSFETTPSGNKRDWVSNAIDYRMIDRGSAYLYLHEGVKLGFYDFRNKKFTPFLNNDCAHMAMHQFIHAMSDKRRLPVSHVSYSKQLQLENEVDEYLNGYLDEDADEQEDDDNVECIDNGDDDSDDSDSEEEVHIVLQTAPVQKKPVKPVKSL